MTSAQTLSESDRRVVALWAADCAERVLPLFEAVRPDDDRPRDAIARARAFGRGELRAADEIRRRFVAGRAAQGLAGVTAAAAASARAAAQAAGVAHMGAHALGAAAYAAKAVELSTAPATATPATTATLAATATPAATVDEELRWQLDRMSPEVRHALSLLPRVGTDTAGPLGSGLLASGALGTHIHRLQDALVRP